MAIWRRSFGTTTTGSWARTGPGRIGKAVQIVVQLTIDGSEIHVFTVVHSEKDGWLIERFNAEAITAGDRMGRPGGVLLDQLNQDSPVLLGWRRRRGGHALPFSGCSSINSMPAAAIRSGGQAGAVRR